MDKVAVFKEFISQYEVLVVDKNPSSRTRLLKIMSDLGCKRHMIHTAGELSEAEQLIATKNIGLILSDYDVGGGSGFDLFNIIRKKNPTIKNLTLVLVTSNISQTAVAKAAEEDVDSFIIKPYTIQSIQENLISTINAKVKPSDYILKVEEGKSFITSGDYKKAISVLQEALKMHSKPALALFYIGQAEWFLDATEKAKGSYTTGLSFNNIHYKCLIGLYNMFLSQEKYKEAYQVVKKVAKFFPANPGRLAEIVRLAVRTENFEDMNLYYEIFTSLDERTDEMVNFIGAGMYVTGKYLMLNKKQDEALIYFDNIVVSCSEYPKFTRAIISTLVEFREVATAEKYLKRFPSGYDQHEDFLVSDYLILSTKLKNNSTLVKRGLDLYNKNIRDFLCMKTMIQAMENCSYKEEMIIKFKHEIQELWPGKSLSLAA